MGVRSRVLVDVIPDGPITAQEFPNLSHAVRAIAERAHEQWLDYAMGAPLPDGQVIQNRTGQYARSIMLRQLTDFSAEVYSELPYAEAIENGTRERDMKEMLRSSMKVRLTKDGRRYLIIPFRWHGPDSLQSQRVPVEVWNWWKGDRANSIVRGSFKRLSGTGAYDIHTRERVRVDAWRYQWGSRLNKAHLGLLGFGPDDRMTKRLAGMVRFAKPGSSNHNQLMTFRVMMEGSPGWIAPAQPGKFPAKQTGDLIAPVAEEIFKRAVEADVAALIGAAE